MPAMIFPALYNLPYIPSVNCPLWGRNGVKTGGNVSHNPPFHLPDRRDGFRGTEDLGGGLKATFELEKRFDLFDGTSGNTNVANYKSAANGASANSGKDWDGAANIGLASDWGRVRFGRVNELTTETIRKFDPFYQYGVGSMILSSQRSARIDNTARYDSPKWAGFSFGASYSLGKNTRNDPGTWTYTTTNSKASPPVTTTTSENWSTNGKTNDGYGVNLSYDNGPFMATANYSRVADSNDSSTWNVGLAYKFGTARISLLYESTDDKGVTGGGNGTPALSKYYVIGADGKATNKSATGKGLDQDLWLLGLEWDIGPGQLDASVQWMQWDQDGVSHATGKTSDRDVWKYAVGYTYNLSKRTSAYAQVSYTDFDEKDAGMYYSGMDRSGIWATQIGMTHKF